MMLSLWSLSSLGLRFQHARPDHCNIEPTNDPKKATHEGRSGLISSRKGRIIVWRYKEPFNPVEIEEWSKSMSFRWTGRAIEADSNERKIILESDGINGILGSRHANDEY